MNRIIVDDALKFKNTAPYRSSFAHRRPGQHHRTVLPEHLGPINMECPHPPEEIARRFANPGRFYTGEEIDGMLAQHHP